MLISLDRLKFTVNFLFWYLSTYKILSVFEDKLGCFLLVKSHSGKVFPFRFEQNSFATLLGSFTLSPLILKDLRLCLSPDLVRWINFSVFQNFFGSVEFSFIRYVSYVRYVWHFELKHLLCYAYIYILKCLFRIYCFIPYHIH